MPILASSLRPITLAALALAMSRLAAQTYTATDRQPTPEELAKLPAVVSDKVPTLLKDVKIPDDFEVSIFATPPAVNYPVYVAAAPDGTLYVSSDGNGSLDRKPHMGRVLRVRDTNGDGQADEVKAFVADVDSPRGLVWDHDRLYLLHPPDVSVFIDKDGDGVADEKKTLISGIGWTFKDRPADHASNGLTLGIDGWLYAAIGDFGFMEATGTDGRKLQMRGGGVVRFRPDGSGMETWAEGTRNILEVAESPLLDGFARDNTNDGGGWDIRLHHFSGLTQHGYPRLFKNFPDEIIQPLADYGGGSGCGAAWIDEPGIPAKWNNAPFTADWGTGWIYRHGLTPKGATYSATQEQFAQLPRVTDLDVDARGAIYAASWKGASFTWVGPEVGFVARIAPKGFKAPAVPDFEKLDDAELLKLLAAPGHRTRLEAQRTLVRRDAGAAARRNASPIAEFVADGTKPMAGRIAAIFALKLALGTEADAILDVLIRDTALQPWVLRALGDNAIPTTAIRSGTIQALLKSPNPVVRKEAVIALSRIGGKKDQVEIAKLLADSDPIVTHEAVRALVALGESDAAFSIIDESNASPAPRSGAFRVLQSLHQGRVVDGLIARLEGKATGATREGIITALCRLHFVDGKWKGDSWGTRPDTRGPYYQPESWEETAKISAALKTALDKAAPTEAAYIGRELARHRIPAGDALEKLISRAAAEPTLLPAIAAQLAEAEDVPASAIPLLVRTATAPDTADAARAQAVIALAKTSDADGWRAAIQALPLVQKTKTENNLSEKASGAVRNSSKLDQVHTVFEELAPKLDGPSSLLAEGMLLRLGARKVGSPEARAAANASLDAGWADAKRRVQILRAAGEVRDTSRAAQFVAALNDPDSEVVKVAKDTVSKLKIDPAKFLAEASAAKVGDLNPDDVLKQVAETKGDVGRGEQIFTQAGCNGCHTVKADEPLKGPFLGTIASIYKRRELAEAVLFPNKTLAQGFVANHFELKDGTELDGFVVREAADSVTVRTITAQEQTIAVAQIEKREKQERSLMPEGLAAGLTVREFASLLEYLEQLSKSGK